MTVASPWSQIYLHVSLAHVLKVSCCLYHFTQISAGLQKKLIVNTGTALMLRIAELVPKHPMRSKRAQAQLQQQEKEAAQAAAAASAGSAGGKPKGKDKKKNKR